MIKKSSLALEWDQGYFGHFPEEVEAYIGQTVRELKIQDRMEELAAAHPDAFDPYNPYCGVSTLFFANAQNRLKDRKDWLVVSPYVIVETDEAKGRRRRMK